MVLAAERETWEKKAKRKFYSARKEAEILLQEEVETKKNNERPPAYPTTRPPKKYRRQPILRPPLNPLKHCKRNDRETPPTDKPIIGH
ncbi:hypothetical protein LTR40_008879, partial [Exophiala xenobiotica]